MATINNLNDNLPSHITGLPSVYHRSTITSLSFPLLSTDFLSIWQPLSPSPFLLPPCAQSMAISDITSDVIDGVLYVIYVAGGQLEPMSQDAKRLFLKRVSWHHRNLWTTITIPECNCHANRSIFYHTFLPHISSWPKDTVLDRRYCSNWDYQIDRPIGHLASWQ